MFWLPSSKTVTTSVENVCTRGVIHRLKAKGREDNSNLTPTRYS
jgi:hypothetical protein